MASRIGSWLRLRQAIKRLRDEPELLQLFRGVLRLEDCTDLAEDLDKLISELQSPPRGVDGRELPKRIADALQLDGDEVGRFRLLHSRIDLHFEVSRERRKVASERGHPDHVYDDAIVAEARRRVARRLGVSERTIRRAFTEGIPLDDF